MKSHEKMLYIMKIYTKYCYNFWKYSEIRIIKVHKNIKNLPKIKKIHKKVRKIRKEFKKLFKNGIKWPKLRKIT